MPDIILTNSQNEDVELHGVNSLEPRNASGQGVVRFIYPTGTLPVSANGTYDVSDKAAVEVNVSGGGGGSVDSGVIFIDYDGSIVESWDAASVASKTALPDNPSHSRLVAQGWNWSLANIKSYISKYEGSKVVVGQMYKTASGLTEFDITLTKVTGLTVTCNMIGNKTWGDGTSDNLTSHTYADYGDYTITCDGTSVSGHVFGQTSSNINRYLCTNAFIGESVTSIDGDAFSSCYSLTSITIPDSVTSIGGYAFNDCYSLTNITIPDSVTSIGAFAFAGCYSLTSITIPDSVTSIGGYAFNYCHSLTNITIPDGVTSIGNYVFNYCHSLTNITIPDSVTSIGNYAFNYCHSLTNITISDGVTSIGGNAFQNCYSLTSINIPDSVTSIGGTAFAGCYSLTSINIPDSVTSIGATAFSGCYSLTSINIPDSVTSIGGTAFQNCYCITKYDFTAATAVPTLANTSAFSNINGICKIIVPDSLYNDWIAATNWSTYANYIYKASEVAA